MGSDTENKQIRLKVLTPMRVVFDSPVDFVIVRSSEGDIGVLYGHEPLSALLDYGLLRIFIDNQENDAIMVLGGVVTVFDNEVVVSSAMAEHPDKLQEAIDKLREERAANKISEQTAALDMHRTQMAIRRALVHMDVSAYAILKDN